MREKIAEATEIDSQNIYIRWQNLREKDIDDHDPHGHVIVLKGGDKSETTVNIGLLDDADLYSCFRLLDTLKAYKRYDEFVEQSNSGGKQLADRLETCYDKIEGLNSGKIKINGKTVKKIQRAYDALAIDERNGI